jgi:trehalose synthase
MVNINNYIDIVGKEIIDGLFIISEKLEGKMIQHINSTSVGGGVAEILTRMIPLLKQLNVESRWDVIKGDEKFYAITKAFHNALHGVPTKFKKEEFEYFVEVNMHNSNEMIFDGDLIFVHDPQPICLVEKKIKSKKKWAWRCHIDFTNPQNDVMTFLEKYIEQYDCSVFSAPAFSRKLKIPQVLVSPSIDPLSDKNKELPEETIRNIVEKYGIDTSRPIVSQISRFDYLKDPVGVIEVYKKVKKYNDCQLVLAGGGATDDPEGMKVLDEVKEASAGDEDIHILFLPPSSDIEINALQRASTIVLQKSLKEGFGLTVAEALWKGKPVIAGAVGGIPLQIKHQYSGILTYTIDGTAFYLKQLLNEPNFAKEIGLNGKNHIKDNFLITRHVRDYLLMFLSLLNEGDVIYFDN